MANLTGITLNFDNNTTQTINVGPQKTTIRTPFGLVDLTGSQPMAPTGVEVADNPGNYDNTSFDPLLYVLPRFWNSQEINQRMWADWFVLGDRDNALDYMAKTLGKPLNMNRLSQNQRKRLNIERLD